MPNSTVARARSAALGGRVKSSYEPHKTPSAPNTKLTFENVRIGVRCAEHPAERKSDGDIRLGRAWRRRWNRYQGIMVIRVTLSSRRYSASWRLQTRCARVQRLGGDLDRATLHGEGLRVEPSASARPEQGCEFDHAVLGPKRTSRIKQRRYSSGPRRCSRADATIEKSTAVL
jgi:hypothetical protein